MPNCSIFTENINKLMQKHLKNLDFSDIIILYLFMYNMKYVSTPCIRVKAKMKCLHFKMQGYFFPHRNGITFHGTGY